VVGNIYTFRFRAKNIVDYSPYSQVVRVGFGAKILPPASVTSVLSLTGPNYISIAWTAVPDANLPTQGYVVQMLEGNNWIEVYNAQYDSNALSFTMFGL
jgi:hypothetical protein